jgi:hypothetical protein
MPGLEIVWHVSATLVNTYLVAAAAAEYFLSAARGT